MSTPGNNFGIGTPGGATVTGNIIEENIIVGNTTGIILFAGSAGNLLRKNFVIGNPGVESSVDHPAAISGFDIRNLTAEGANTFQSNICLTAVNAPCPATTLPSLTATPNPILITEDGEFGITTISWLAPGVEAVEIRLNRPDGELFTSGGSRGSARTAAWVADGMMFFLQDVSGGRPLSAENTLASVAVRMQKK